MIIGISGKIGSGKDTIGGMIQSLGQESIDTAMGFPSWQIKKFATKLKQIAGILLGVDPEKFEDRDYKDSYLPKEWNQQAPGFKDLQGRMKVREFLQMLGTDALRVHLHTNVWVNALFAGYKPLNRGANGAEGPPYIARSISNEEKYITYPNWIITDVRFPNEADAVKERGGVMIRLERHDLLRLGYIDKLPHQSEVGLDNYEHFDYKIENNGSIEELQEKVSEVLEGIKQKG